MLRFLIDENNQLDLKSPSGTPLSLFIARSHSSIFITAFFSV